MWRGNHWRRRRTHQNSLCRSSEPPASKSLFLNKIYLFFNHAQDDPMLFLLKTPNNNDLGFAPSLKNNGKNVSPHTTSWNRFPQSTAGEFGWLLTNRLRTQHSGKHQRRLVVNFSTVPTTNFYWVLKGTLLTLELFCVTVVPMTIHELKLMLF